MSSFSRGNPIAKSYTNNLKAQDAAVAQEKAIVSGATGIAIPKSTSIMAPNGTLSNKFKVMTPEQAKAQELSYAQLGADPQALNALRNRGLQSGAGSWLDLQLQNQQLGELTAMDNAGGNVQAAAASQRAQLASRGGLSAGAAERSGSSAANNLALLQSQIARGGQTDRLGLQIADDETKTQVLGQVAGLDLQSAGQKQDLAKFNAGSALDASKFNIANSFDANKLNTQNAIGGVQADNLSKFGYYQEQMKGYSAGKQAQATAASGKK